MIFYQEKGNSMKLLSTFEGKIGVNGIGKFGLITDTQQSFCVSFPSKIASLKADF